MFFRHLNPPKRHACLGNQPSETPSEWLLDGNGIELCRVCPKCRAYHTSKYRPEILRPYTQSDVIEDIEGEEG